MNCCHNEGLEREFNRRRVTQKLTRYQRDGPDRSTQLLIDALVARGVRDATMLDIGGGVGAIQHGLLAAGLHHSVCVDASQAYIAAATNESARRGYANRTSYIHGDFVALAETVPFSDVVTLDRVICCYPDMPALVKHSVAKAQRLYGIVVPRPIWLVRLARQVINGVAQLERSPFRFFVHSTQHIAEIVDQQGFSGVFSADSGVWQVRVYERRM